MSCDADRNKIKKIGIKLVVVVARIAGWASPPAGDAASCRGRAYGASASLEVAWQRSLIATLLYITQCNSSNHKLFMTFDI